MGKKQKSKVKGSERTANKTIKKQNAKLLKEMKGRGEEDIDTILAKIASEELKQVQAVATKIEAPSRRVHFAFVAHPLKDSLIMHGGEYFDGKHTTVFSDLLFYDIERNSWTKFKTPKGPPPRCAHQMAAVPSEQGQLWIFGGEFTNPTQSQFYHYKDLWVFHLKNKQWEKIDVPNGPSARSGHRLVASKRQLIVFGGFYENHISFKYFNDLYSFSLDTYQWTEIKTSGSIPSPRSGCCMVAMNDGRILLYGGYSKEKVQKDVDKGHIHTDSYILAHDKNDPTDCRRKWIQTKIGGFTFPPRCSMSIAVTSNGSQAFCFGGVLDTEDDESVYGTFYNDLLSLDLNKLVWKEIVIGRKPFESIKSNVEDDNQDITDISEAVKNTVVADDGIFKVVVGQSNPSTSNATTCQSNNPPMVPLPRASCGLVIKSGVLYVFGGSCEDGDKEITFCDFHSLDIKKLDMWKTLISDDILQIEWLESESDGETSSTESESIESDDSEV